VLNGMRIVVVIPAYNAAQTLARTCAELPRDDVDEVLVVDDHTQQRTDRIKNIAPPLFPVPYSLFPAFVAFGTPFAGELARIGENMRAPIAALYLLDQGPGNTLQDVSQAEAVRALLQNILFFAQDDELAQLVFQTAFEFVRCVPVRRLVFAPDARVWDLIR
jgi:hypothetical protein